SGPADTSPDTMPSRYHRIMGRFALLVLAACGSSDPADPGTDPETGPPAGNPNGTCAIPAGADLEDVSQPTTVIGDGSPDSCTSAAVVAAVAGGGVITFDCGPDPITIAMEATAKIVNNTGPRIVIDGGGKVT